MTGFVLFLWIVIVLCIEHELKSRIKKLEEHIAVLSKERRVILSEDIESLTFVRLPLPPGSQLIDSEGVRDAEDIPVLTFKSKKQGEVNG